MATATKRPKVPRALPPAPVPGRPGIASSAGVQLAPSDEALRLILGPAARGEGFRHGAFGGPGAGKTWGIRSVINAAITCGAADLVITHDVKGRETEFPDGTQMRSPADLTPAALAELDRTRHAVIRGDPMRDDVELPVEPVALVARRILRYGIPTCLNAGELDACLTDGGRSWTAPTVRWFSSQGRKLQGSLVWTTQQPKRVPDEIFDQSTTIAFHHLDVRSVTYLRDTLQLDPEMVALLPRLARGEFVLWIPGYDWNRSVYRFPPPPAGGGGRRELAAVAA